MKLDPHRNESTTELEKSIWLQYLEAKANADAWEKVAQDLRQSLVVQLGDAYAGTVDGRKVVTHRPKNAYAVSRLEKEHYDLVQHFQEAKVTYVTDVARFAKAYPEIAEQYRTRSFNTLGTIEE
jgi:hypothetical protein